MNALSWIRCMAALGLAIGCCIHRPSPFLSHASGQSPQAGAVVSGGVSSVVIPAQQTGAPTYGSSTHYFRDNGTGSFAPWAVPESGPRELNPPFTVSSSDSPPLQESETDGAKTEGTAQEGSGDKESSDDEAKSGDSAEAKDDEDQESLADRLESLEKELKKIKEAEEKKKAEDAAKPSVKPRGRLHADSNWFRQSDLNRATLGDIQDGAYFRRIRLGLEGKAFEVSEYRVEWDMTSGGGRPSITDVYGRITHLPRLGNIQIGHFREPFSLEAQTSSNWITFIERGLNNTFDPARNWGVMVFDHNEAETLAWAYGIFREGSDNFGDDIGDSGERAVTGRVSWLPYYDEPSEGRYFWEIGGSYSYRDPDNRFIPAPGGMEESIVRYQGRPNSNLNEDGVGGVPAFVSISVPDAVDVQLVGVESAWNLGRLNLQTEFIGSHVDRAAAPSAFFHGMYLQTSYFLTGESRQWDRKLGTYARQQVFEPFFRVCTKNGICTSRGAIDWVARWNYLDLSDASLNGGYMDVSTLGLNWYLSPYTRLMFNYSFADLHDPTDGQSSANVVNCRLDFHF